MALRLNCCLLSIVFNFRNLKRPIPDLSNPLPIHKIKIDFNLFSVRLLKIKLKFCKFMSHIWKLNILNWPWLWNRKKSKFNRCSETTKSIIVNHQKYRPLLLKIGLISIYLKQNLNLFEVYDVIWMFYKHNFAFCLTNTINTCIRLENSLIPKFNIQQKF